ncbi:ankyrin repeat domain-containing protein [Cytophaga sp. FL35]|uniref:ankyrin repeat domain-containing protein n=1 Tax=Cytophaga sp. FL35 TaxID=1904456 RepID=UPI0016537843|nr:ankyrin repeat domain-containing protein [Cytophaga sp. FL35]MBC6999873.1 ankyrin repeat domain-containing protein [Cytophaga sp. FL35]
MKKTILSAALVCLAFSTGLEANAIDKANEGVVIENIKNLEVSSFCKAIMQGDIDTVKKLIDLGEDINQKSLGMTPAIYAARYNKAEILQLLIDNGANLKIKSDKGYSVMKYAELSNATEALQVLETALGS